METFPEDTVSAVLAHMNGDHLDDNLVIVRANGAPEAGTWTVMGPEGPLGDLRIPWRSGPITERGEIRREVVALYDAACAALGEERRPH
jgi:hypothetical protein